MKTIRNIIRKALYVAAPLLMAAAAGLVTSCSDVDIPDAPSVNPVSGLTATVSNRDVTLKWSPVAGDIAKYVILQNGDSIGCTDASVTTFEVKKVIAGIEQAFTVKAAYKDGKVSEGVTTFVTVVFSGPKSAYLVFTDQMDDDEKASYDWFDKNYVQTGKGEFIKVGEVGKLDHEIYGCLWIHIDENGIGDITANRWAGKPAEAVLAVIDKIAEYGKKGGNLLLCNHATQLVGELGRIETKYNPHIIGDGDGGDGGDIWTCNPFLGYVCDPCYDNSKHAVYAGMSLEKVDPNWPEGYPMIGPGRREDHNCCWDLNSYGFNLSRYGNTVNAYQSVNKCTVLGTWSHVGDYAVAGAIDFNPTATWGGRIVAMGLAAYEWNQNSGANPYQGNIEKFAANALNYMSEKPEYIPSTEGAYYGYVISADSYEQIPDDDEQASARWFKDNYVDKQRGGFILARDINRLSKEDYACIMVHIDRVGLANDVAQLPAEMGSDRVLNALADYVKDGGNLFLNNHASLLVQAIGRIPADPCRITVFGSGDGGEGGDIWTANPYQGYMDKGKADGQCYDHTGHHIFKGMTAEKVDPGWPEGYPLIGPGHREDHNCCYDVNGMGYPCQPNNIKNFEDDQNCVCLATWSHVQDWCVSGITEFLPKGDYKGRIIAIGLAAYEWNQNSGANPYQGNIERIATNSLDYLAE
ncbi:MAG: DUF4960 domain-containing protein [Bacteroidaceae bacterium]|nr:DUF4960 domain-containing protein [Bacteroidaceae bacterium]